MKERRLLFLESHATQSVWQGAYDFVIPERTARLTGSSLVMNRIFNVQSLRQFSLLSTLCICTSVYVHESHKSRSLLGYRSLL